MAERRRNHRDTFKLNLTEPQAANLYPINSALTIRDATRQLTITPDRCQGGMSLSSGSMELLVQRRLLADDGEGVNEALNETTGGMVGYPEALGNKTAVPIRNGTGIIVRGRHFLSFGRPHDATGHRGVQEELMHEPVVRLTKQTSISRNEESDHTTTAALALAEPLPSAVIVLTVEALSNDTTLVRLWHRYGLGEDTQLAVPVNVSLARVLPGAMFRSASLLSVTANQDYEDMRRKRKKWTTQGSEEINDDHTRRISGMVVEIRPMEVLTMSLAK
jgi:hypothetical protein